MIDTFVEIVMNCFGRSLDPLSKEQMEKLDSLNINGLVVEAPRKNATIRRVIFRHSSVGTAYGDRFDRDECVQRSSELQEKAALVEQAYLPRADSAQLQEAYPRQE
jgi:hypothetical protein